MRDMIKNKFSAVFTIIFCCAITVVANAQDNYVDDIFEPQISIGMKNMKPKPAKPDDTPKSEEVQKTNPPPTATKPTLPSYTELDTDEALVKEEDLEPWASLSMAVMAQNRAEAEKLVYTIESDKGAVPPKGLFLAAQTLASQKMMKQASLYYLVGQLRLSFDMARWPSYEDEKDKIRLAQDAQKSDDQKAPNQSAGPRIHNPHRGVQDLSETIGQPIIAWLLKDPKRFEALLNEARQWDASAPYLYDTGYKMGASQPFDTWGKLLIKTREAYFSRMNSLLKAMQKVKR